MTRFDFSGRNVLVTGAARGLGLSISEAFMNAGATVALTDADISGLEQGAGRAAAENALAVTMNVSDPEQVREAFDLVRARIGPISVLVNNAGICATTDFLDLTPREWRNIIEVNLSGAFYCMREAVRQMVREGLRGKIINIASLAARSGGIAVAASYSASKAGLIGLTKAAARQLAGKGICVNAVAPGTMDTALTRGWSREIRRALIGSIPLGRLGEVEEVSAAVLFLASPEADFITGITLDVNGGQYLAG